ncbi:addiction module toxin, HicA family [Marispirochaeta aestuarii]|uniref:Addiction module toxin, HicA family n=1 Tax=Marispirochaeta aestuarii TaxID=1963862 RepID=A0A1Y1RZ17_9SPIO|nr:type II toxin-antitoxin system HicA family toxin [Marispirochaeta aestuarii]ORC35909.1 addiction module toxin, HicA family [Marispirochaeta aestuarii]
MGRLAGFNYKKCIKKLRKLGFEFDRGARGSHEIWWNKQTRARTTIPNHPGDIPEGTMKAILKQAGVDTDDFLNI